MKSESLLIQPGLHWYAIQTKGKREKEVAKRLADLQIETFLPWLRHRRRVGSKFQWVLAPLFPNYLFGRMDIFLSGKAVRYCAGVKDLVKFGNEVAPVGDEIIFALRERCPGDVAEIASVALQPGQRVEIKEGPFAGLEAIFEKKMKGSERVAVLLEILGRRTRLTLRSEAVAKM